MPRETPHFPITAILTGHFHESRGYTNWRQRGTPDWLLIYTVAGRGRFGYPTPTGHAEILAHPGDVVLLKPATLHDYGVEPSLQRWNLLWAHFQPRPHWLDWLSWPPVSSHASGLMRISIPDTPTRRRIRQRLSQMNALAISAHARRTDLALNALESVLLTLDAMNPLQAQSHLDPRIRSVMDLLCGHLGQSLPLHRLASHANLSISRFAHLFRQQTGQTPQRFLEFQRLDRAKQLLALTPATIKEIAYQVGFQNPFYFSLRFKRHTGRSPRAFRRSRSH